MAAKTLDWKCPKLDQQVAEVCSNICQHVHVSGFIVYGGIWLLTDKEPQLSLREYVNN